ncbi:MAG: nicotinate (nicotinamide) nucleotide adenylyltransferase [Oligoflexia bacterium]|nr:nicotinate (nicotinamide) nucleotide adenylyltransferase [Oligoflexia bacterium]
MKKTKTKKTKVKKTARPAKTKVLSDERIGLFGGAFNPIHVGHLKAAMTVKMNLNLDKVYFIPTFKAPHREITGPGAQDRAELIQAAITNYQDELGVSDVEIKRKGISYTIDTLKEFNKTHKSQNIYFIVGADAFNYLHTWRSFSELLKLSQFVVVTRPGVEFSFYNLPEDLNAALKPYVKTTSLNKIVLKNKNEIHLVQLQDNNASSTDIRKRLRTGGDVRNMVPEKVLNLIQEKGFYKRSIPAIKDFKHFATFCAEAALDKKALSLKIYDMLKRSSYSDYSLICSGTSTRHTVSIAENIIDKVKEEFGVRPLSFEGSREGRWVLVDYGALVVHVFEDAERMKYKIEELWKGCPQVQ